MVQWLRLHTSNGEGCRLPWWLSQRRIRLRCKRSGFEPWIGKIPWRRDRPSTLVFLGFPGDSAGKESAYNAGDLGLIPGLGRSLGEGNATHSRILAWRIPWTEEPGGLQSVGCSRQEYWSGLHFLLQGIFPTQGSNTCLLHCR